VAAKVAAVGGEIKMNAAVKTLQTREGVITGVTYVEKGEEKTLHGDIVISSMPLRDLAEGLSNRVLSENAKKIAAGLPYRDFVTVGLLVNRLNLINKTDIKTLNNIVPDCWIYVQDTGVKLGRIQIFNNWSPYMVADPANTVWIGLEYFCNEGDDFWNMTDADCIAFAARELAQMGIIAEGDVLDSHRERVQKAYPAYFDTYGQIEELTAELDAIPNLYCVGRNGQHRYNNMDHSMLTAMAAVETIRTGSNDKSAIWNVNTEEEYHEEK